MQDKLLEIKNLKKYYGKGDSEVRALDDVSFDVYKGEMLVLLGNSGCGKSTLLNIIGGMDSPTFVTEVPQRKRAKIMNKMFKEIRGFYRLQSHFYKRNIRP